MVKPADGSSGRAVRLVATPDRLLDPVETAGAGDPGAPGGGLLIAQPYVPNSGTDLKVYSVAGELYATERCSPLHPAHAVRERQVPLTPDIARITAEIGTVFGLDLYGVDILLGPDGPVVVDINDFPSFRQVPDAVARVSAAILDLARHGRAGQAAGPAAGQPAAGPVAAKPGAAAAPAAPPFTAPPVPRPSRPAASIGGGR